MEFYFSLPSTTSIKKFLVWFLFFGNLLGIVVLWLTNSSYYIQNPADGNILIALGRITGLLAEYFILVQLMLIGRVRWLEHLFGFDVLNKIHRWIGYSILSLLLTHPLLLTIGNAQANGVPLLSQFADFLANKKDVLNAFFALLIFIFIVVISIVIVRKKLRYETWYFTHLFTYLAIGLALTHQLGTGDLRSGWGLTYWYVLNFAVFGFVLLYRLIRPLYLFWRHRFFVEHIVEETPDTFSLYISGKNLDRFKFEAGQYANITILARGMWYTHPFSFSSAYNGAFLRFSIKSLGDYTSKIRELKPGTPIIIDGPLGLFVEKRATRDKFLFIAGGIGITPLRAMIESLTAQKKDMVLLCGSRTEKDIAFKDEFELFKQQSPSLTTHHILGTPTEGYESGFIDKEKIVRLVPDFYTREVFLCGPPPMMKIMVGHLNDLGFDAHHIHYEKFSF
ncbi:MAG: hypothetical protein A2675_00325 [Candidatus Yonathbacteria bacterium RIFCSPHIGHO2_01_FULL_51_10]|uniref:FAD-binding FR-type domain-containing protein n=1 Tax=Candidatus Yonathbacteria bacterium RIFCSPHIGHO2_01_FULL_51_10 TaxID=1802723 RepID=A0A1G2S4P0_9BACT|nr:MAG: hypothetical protein A2675_00325 [Candidatus Yonathbacteria bacterium RIFCSPHIGHO2_01_FULL_51_10]